jgi:hypothetical protein
VLDTHRVFVVLLEIAVAAILIALYSSSAAKRQGVNQSAKRWYARW